VIPPFHPFTAPHFLAVGLVLIITAAAVRWGRRQSPERAAAGGRVIAWTLLGWYAIESVVRVGFLGVPFADLMPFEMCNALFFIGPIAYFTRDERAFEVVYFWTMVGTIHAMITPTPRGGFPDPNYFQYFIAHGLLILSAGYTALAMRRGTSRGAMWRAFLALQVFAVVVGGIDFVSGHNYFYLHQKPPSPTLLDALGPWPWYLLAGEAVALASFLVWSLPFAIPRWFAARPTPEVAR
jgi:hypothetical integral membrane protein (TIGR02206 family)